MGQLVVKCPRPSQTKEENMPRVIRVDYEQTMMFPPRLEDWVPADHPARFVRDFVNALDLKRLGIKDPEGLEGRPCYAGEMLTTVWLYGYYRKIRSSRGLERACREEMSLIWLTGNQPPDHNTLWRFWRDNKKALKGVYRQSVQVALKADLVGWVLHALDGTKIAAEVSTAKGLHRSELEKCLKGLDRTIEEAMSEVEKAEETERGEYRLPEELTDARVRRERIRQSLTELDGARCDHLHRAEPEARVMPTGEGKRLGYNAQAVVDGKSGLIVAEEVSTSAADHGQLKPMLQEVKATVGQVAQETVADGGYYSGEQLAGAEEMGAGVLVHVKDGPERKDSGYGKWDFTYDAEKDVYRCPLGAALAYEREKWAKGHAHRLRVYRCRCAPSCPKRATCSTERRGRSIERGPYDGAVRRQLDKQQEATKAALLAKRGEIVEIVFARLKAAMGFRRWTVRGLENVRAQWALLCTALNLQKLYGYWLKGELKLTGT
jgi:transposase